MNASHAVTTASPMGSTLVSRSVLHSLWVGAVAEQIIEDLFAETVSRIERELSAR